MMLDVKTNYLQSDESLCAPACIKTVLKYFGKEVEESEIARLCGHTYELGTDDINMKKAAEGLGFTVQIKNFATFSDIDYWLERKVPLIVDWFCGENLEMQTIPNGHSSIVIGLDEEFIYLLNPELEDVMIVKREEFMRVWFDFRTSYIEDFDSMIIRQIFVILPK
jgi:ABC-type bacteriocin/lantibiotic exporter with double-glycine peptidase domain